MKAACRAICRAWVMGLGLLVGGWGTSLSLAADVSAPAFFQWYETSWRTMERRTADVFAAGYGSIWVPPVGRAEGGQSVGYDVYDRFDLGSTGRPTFYGTESQLKKTINTWHQAGLSAYADMVWNHAAFSDNSTPGFFNAGGYPGLNITLPGAIDGDFHSAFATGDLEGRLSGLVDIDQGTNHFMIRNPVPGFANNIRAGTIPAFGRLANVPNENNRRFYPDQQQQPIMLFDPVTGETNIAVYPFNNSNPLAGDPVAENALGYLMRNNQWLVQHVGFDGFRIDAAKHMPLWVYNYYDRAVYRSNPRTNLDGSPRHVFGFVEAFDSSTSVLNNYVKKNINPNDTGRIGGNRDALDFSLFDAFQKNLTSNGVVNNWNNVRNAALDVTDDGLHNGSRGVMFVQSHDSFGPHLNNVAHAYILMHPGNAIVYMNGKEYGDNRDFPKAGRGDALGGIYGDTITTLVELRNTHGRGNYLERYLEKENFAYEREGSALVLLSNRTDSGFDSRTMDVNFPWGTYLVELTGNAALNPNIPQVVRVRDDFFEGPTKVDVRFLRNGGTGDKGYLIYGLQNPKSQNGIELTNVHSVLEGGTPPPNDYQNGITRLADISVIKGNTFNVTLHTQAVTLPNGVRDPDADGDNALLRINDGFDANGNGQVDYRTPGPTSYGFEEFATVRTPGYGSPTGNGVYTQTIDATRLPEGYNFITTRAYRRRTDGGPAVFTDFRETIYIDRLLPVSAVDSFHPFGSGVGDNDIWIRSLDKTADNVKVFLNLPANQTDAQILALVNAGQGNTDRLDQDIFKTGFFGMTSGNNAVTVVTYEITGTYNIQRLTGVQPANARGAGLADLNFDGQVLVNDLYGAGSFEQVLYSQNAQFNPAADLNADGRIDNRDLYELGEYLVERRFSQSVLNEYDRLLRRRGNMNAPFNNVDSFDIDALRDNLGSTAWVYDLDVNGTAGPEDVDLLVRTIFHTDYGDANLDTLINREDLSLLRANWLLSGRHWAQGDFSGDGLVNQIDLAFVQTNWNSLYENFTQASTAVGGFPIPEPGYFYAVGLAVGAGFWFNRGWRVRSRSFL
ncbi:MAG: hypothetical protein SFX18_19450 [Pirellulales bacterium]|nr:hypothetical protein [Pirellulales bacterium]